MKSADEILQVPLAELTWYHLQTLMDRVKDKKTYIWYVVKTIDNGWSRNILLHQIETNLYNRITAEYALKDMSKPIGVSEYRLSDFVPKELINDLPSAQDI